MKTQLFEMRNRENETLRGIISMPMNTVQKGVICLHGFERCSSTEKKFKILSDALVEKGTAVLRLDFAGCGLSDGEFRGTTIEKLADDFVLALRTFKDAIGKDAISIVAHSLGACAVAATFDDIKDEIEKKVLIAPALNQKDLLRYWFVVSHMKECHPDVDVTWHNYRQFLDEDAFHKDSERTDKMTKANYIDSKFFLEAKAYDFSSTFDSVKHTVLHIHGTEDRVVPIESIHTTFDTQIIVKNGDHDVEKPNQLEQWNHQAVDFLLQ